MSRVKICIGTAVMVAVAAATFLASRQNLVAQQGGAASGGYAKPRFPSTFKTPRTVEEIMPYARALARNKSNILGLGFGVLNAGDSTAIVASAASEDIYVEAIKRALEERKIKVAILRDYELMGVTRDQALALQKAQMRGTTSEQGYLEAAGWMRSWPGSAEWLKQRRPDLAASLFPADAQSLPPALQAVADKMRANGGVVKVLLKYIADHPGLRGVYYGRGGPIWMNFHPHEDKWLGVFVADNRWDVVPDVSSYPADLWMLTEEMTMEPLAYVDQVHVTDPEGTDVSWSLTEEQARRWSKGVYLRGHLFMFPQEAYGQYALSVINYPAIQKEYIPAEPMALMNGVVAGTNGHGGFFPRIEEHFVNGYLKEVKGGGLYGETLREAMKYPKIHEVKYPLFEHPGYFYHFETALGTNPKVIRHDLGTFWGTSPERMRSGVVHWALGAHYWNDPGSFGGRSQLIQKFAEQNKMPGEHGFHIHSYFNTFKVHLRNTSKWVTLVDKGRLTALDNSEVRALASRYGDADQLLMEAWVPDVPGINAPGNYLADYAPNPYKVSQGVMEKVEAGTYPNLYPAPGKGTQPSAR